ncbi:hypothetical protein NQ315_017465 [Exocentrus adspersus]|uniref:Uncharacterized protein n=1 Tax=Exocentrus adspersus TaxID=1586481 RepID=A0AAV8VK73_9CUCU|nr:hypothetical protein NQ315_017465 [Exocentrus adspersus]
MWEVIHRRDKTPPQSKNKRTPDALPDYLGNTEKSRIAQHVWEEQHQMHWDQATIIVLRRASYLYVSMFYFLFLFIFGLKRPKNWLCKCPGIGATEIILDCSI